jgi:hypothetical protein
VARNLPIKLSIIVAVAATAVSVAGCQEYRYLARRDSVTMGVGDAPATNQATHTINLWPRNAKDTKITSDGKRVLVGVKRYQENKSIEPKGLTNGTDSIGEGPGGNGDPGIKR